VDGLNLYHYVRNNPVNGVDKLGYSTDSIHKDADGNVVAVYLDGDNGVYQHDDLSIRTGQHVDGIKSIVDQRHDLLGSSGGGELIGMMPSASLKTDPFGEGNPTVDGYSYKYLKSLDFKGIGKGEGLAEQNTFSLTMTSSKEKFDFLKNSYLTDPGLIHNEGNLWGTYTALENPDDDDEILDVGDVMYINIAGPYNGAVEFTGAEVTENSFKIDATILDGGMLSLNHPDAGYITFSATFNPDNDEVSYSIYNNTQMGGLVTEMSEGASALIFGVIGPRKFQQWNWEKVLNNVESTLQTSNSSVSKKEHKKNGMYSRATVRKLEKNPKTKTRKVENIYGH
jgi:hypothetical protein